MIQCSINEEAVRRRLSVNVRGLRNGARLTLKKASERAEMHWRHWQKIEAGQVNITLQTLVRVAEVLGVDPCDLLREPPARLAALSPSAARAAPERAAPELGAPKVGSPEVGSPELHSPELHSPELHSPELHSPELHSPELHSPKLDLPEIDLPELDARELGGPSSSRRLTADEATPGEEGSAAARAR